MQFTLIKDTSSIKDMIMSTPQQRSARRRGAQDLPFGLEPSAVSAAQILLAKLKQRQLLMSQFEMLSRE